MDEDTTLGLDFSAFNMDNSKSSNQVVSHYFNYSVAWTLIFLFNHCIFVKDENFHSRPFTPEKPYEVPQSAAMSSTESLPQSLTRPTLTYSERNMSSPASDISLPIHLSSNNPASPTTESECSLQRKSALFNFTVRRSEIYQTKNLFVWVTQVCMLVSYNPMTWW